MTQPRNKSTEFESSQPMRTAYKFATLFWIIILPCTAILPAMGGTFLRQSSVVAWTSDSVLTGVLVLGELAIFCLLVSRRWDSIPRMPAGLPEWCWLVAGLAVCVLGGSVLGGSVESGTLTSVGAVAVWGCALYVHKSADGSGALIYFFPPLLLCCSLPESLRQASEGGTAQLLGVAVTPVLGWLKIPFQHGDRSLVFANGTLEFERFAMTPMTTLLVFSALLVVAWYRRPIASIPFYVTAALLWAFGMSVGKIVFFVACMDGSSGVGADGLLALLTAVSFAMSLGLLFSTDRLVRILLFQVPAFDNKKNSNNPLLLAWNLAFQQMSVSGKLLSQAPTQSRSEHA